MRIKYCSILATALIVFTTLLLPINVSANDACDVAGFNDPLLCGTKNSDEEAELQGRVGNVLGTIYIWIGIIAVIFIIVGGISFMTSSGDQQKITRAKKTITYSVAGLVVTLAAFAITNFFIGALEGRTEGGSGEVATTTEDHYKVKAVRPSFTKRTLYIDDTTTLTVSIIPDYAKNRTVTYTSNNPKVATVDKNGKIRAISAGEATITVASPEGPKQDVTITVKKRIEVTKITLDPTKISLEKGKSRTITATIEPKNAYDKTITWSSSDKKIATVDKNGKVTAKKAGNATITAKSTNGITATSKVEVYVQSKETFKNPIGSGADPWVYRKDDYYYYVRSVGNGIQIYKTTKLNKLQQSGGKVVYRNGSSSIWAPELHYYNGRWYIYAAIVYGSNASSRRMYVLESKSSDPLGSYTMIGELSTSGWAIDGTLMEYSGKLYFIWSGWPGGVNGRQNLYIARMSSPKKISGSRVLISSASQGWETLNNDPYVNEGPEVLKHNGKVFIIYSANGSWYKNYCLGMLTLSGSNPLSASAWKKSGPVFSSGNGVYGPGHASFVKSPDRKEDWIVYHANTSSSTPSGDSWWAARKIFIQPFTWNSNGTPNFGKPKSTSTKIRVPSGTR